MSTEKSHVYVVVEGGTEGRRKRVEQSSGMVGCYNRFRELLVNADL